MDKIDVENIITAILAVAVIQRRKEAPDALGAVAEFQEVPRELTEAEIIGKHPKPHPK